jgi:hypothetical protein
MMKKDIYKEAVNDIKVDERLLKELAIKMKGKPRKRNMGKYTLVAASLAVLLVAAVFINNTGLFSTKKIAKLNAGDSITLSKGKGTVYINKIEGIRSSKLFIPEGSVSKDYDMGQLAEVFGRNPLPAVPNEFKSLTDTTNITFDPSGKLLFMSPISYSKDINNPDAPSIDIRLNKNELPLKDCLYGGDIKESTIGSTKVVIGALSMEDKFDTAGKPTETYDVYTAEFIYNEIGYNITAKRVDGETFINLLNSIILNSEK